MLRLPGGGGRPVYEMSMAAGGRIKQVITKDTLGQGKFDTDFMRSQEKLI